MQPTVWLTLIKEDITILKKAKKSVQKLETEIEDLQNNTFYFIKNLQESSIDASYQSIKNV